MKSLLRINYKENLIFFFICVLSINHIYSLKDNDTEFGINYNVRDLTFLILNLEFLFLLFEFSSLLYFRIQHSNFINKNSLFVLVLLVHFAETVQEQKMIALLTYMIV